MILLETLLKTYGYWAIAAGTFAEGETILVLGGFAAHSGFLSLTGVIFAAFIGSLLVNQLFFFLGRTQSQRVLARYPLWKDRIYKTQQLLERFQIPLILGFRFIYGMRTVTSFVVGMSAVSIGRFTFLNIVSAMLWATVVGSAGYLFGNILEIILGDIERYELYILGAIAVIGMLLWTVRRYRDRKKRVR
jgi:membrane protein DedA with SNARE-associated domain